MGWKRRIKRKTRELKEGKKNKRRQVQVSCTHAKGNGDKDVPGGIIVARFLFNGIS